MDVSDLPQRTEGGVTDQTETASRSPSTQDFSDGTRVPKRKPKPEQVGNSKEIVFVPCLLFQFVKTMLFVLTILGGVECIRNSYISCEVSWHPPSLLRRTCLCLCLHCSCSAISWHFLPVHDGVKTLINNKNYSVYPSYTSECILPLTTQCIKSYGNYHRDTTMVRDNLFDIIEKFINTSVTFYAKLHLD